MASIDINIFDAFDSKLRTITVQKQEYLVYGSHYVVEETFYDGEMCSEEHRQSLDTWRSNGEQGSPPVKRQAVRDNTKDPIRFIFTERNAVYAYLYQQLWWMAEIQDEYDIRFEMTTSYKDIPMNHKDNSMSLENFKILLEHSLCMFDNVTG